MAETPLTSSVKFLGGYVKQFNATFGWNSTPSVLDITIIDKPGEADFNPNLSTNRPGNLKKFKLSPYSTETDFEFTGIITSDANNFKNLSENSYKIQLQDPRLIMKHIHLVLCPNPGTITEDTNDRVIDVFNRINQDTIIPDSGQYIDISTYDKGGINAINVLYAIGLINNDTPTLFGFGVPQPIEGQIQTNIWGINYTFRLDDESIINPNFKVTGDVITLADFIQQLADGNGFDWYVTNADIEIIGGEPFYEINIKTISRQSDNTDISLDDFMDDIGDDLIETAQSGTELRNEYTGAIIFTDNREFLDQVPNTIFDAEIAEDSIYLQIPDYIEPTVNGIPVDVNEMLDGYQEYSIRPHRIRLPIDGLTFAPLSPDEQNALGYLPYDNELRAALIGFDTWLMYIYFVRQHPLVTGELNALFEHVFNNTANQLSLQFDEITEDFWETQSTISSPTIDAIAGPDNPESLPNAKIKIYHPVKISDLAKWAYDSKEYKAIRYLKRAYDIVSQFARENYGRIFAFRQRKDADIVQSASTRTITLGTYDGGSAFRKASRTGFEYDLIGDGRPSYIVDSIADSMGASVLIDTFFDDGNGNGRTNAYAFFLGVTQEDLTRLNLVIDESADNIYFADDGLYVKGEVSNGLIKISPVYDLANTPCVVNDSIAESVLSELGLSVSICNDTTSPSGELSNNICDAILSDSDNLFKMFAKIRIPDSIYIPYKHKREVWNTYKSSTSGIFGDAGIFVEKDTSLSPANLSNFAEMDALGNAKVDALTSNIRELTTASISAVGLPKADLGDQIGNNSNITNISVSFGLEKISTTYNLEAYIKRYGKKSKNESDGFDKIVNKIKKDFTYTNQKFLDVQKEKTAIIDDIKKHTTYRIVGDMMHNNSFNPFGCEKVVFFE